MKRNIAVMYWSGRRICFNTGSTRIGGDLDLGSSVAYAYNETVNEDYILLEKEHPAYGFICQAFECDPRGNKLIGVFVKGHQPTNPS